MSSSMAVHSSLSLLGLSARAGAGVGIGSGVAMMSMGMMEEETKKQASTSVAASPLRPCPLGGAALKAGRRAPAGQTERASRERHPQCCCLEPQSLQK